jgi:hypothetical protein
MRVAAAVEAAVPVLAWAAVAQLFPAATGVLQLWQAAVGFQSVAYAAAPDAVGHVAVV